MDDTDERIKTLTALVKSMDESNEELRKRNHDLLNEVFTLNAEIDVLEAEIKACKVISGGT